MHQKKKLENMTDEDAIEYLKEHSADPSKRPGGIEGDLFSQVDGINQERQQVEEEIKQLQERLQQLSERHQQLVGGADNIVAILVAQEDKRRGKSPEK